MAEPAATRAHLGNGALEGVLECAAPTAAPTAVTVAGHPDRQVVDELAVGKVEGVLDDLLGMRADDVALTSNGVPRGTRVLGQCRGLPVGLAPDRSCQTSTSPARSTVGQARTAATGSRPE